jgi:hypothetical protein
MLINQMLVAHLAYFANSFYFHLISIESDVWLSQPQ